MFMPYFYNQLWAYSGAATIQGVMFSQVNTVSVMNKIVMSLLALHDL